MLGLLRRKGRRRLGKTKRDQKRRDKKGRILRNGESQRKDGRYAFVYTDCYGKQKFLYSWKLANRFSANWMQTMLSSKGKRKKYPKRFT